VRGEWYGEQTIGSVSMRHPQSKNIVILRYADAVRAAAKVEFYEKPGANYRTGDSTTGLRTRDAGVETQPQD